MQIAHDRGIKVISAFVLKANEVMVHMFSRRGFKLRSEDFETYYAEMVLED